MSLQRWHQAWRRWRGWHLERCGQGGLGHGRGWQGQEFSLPVRPFGLIPRCFLLAERDLCRSRGPPHQPLPLCCLLPAEAPALDGDSEGLGSPKAQGLGWDRAAAPSGSSGLLQGAPFRAGVLGTALGPISGMREVLPGSQHDPWIDTQHDQLWGGWSWEWALQPCPHPPSLVDWAGCGVGLQQWVVWHSRHCPGGGSARAPCPHLGTRSHPDRCPHRGRPQDPPQVHLPPPLLQRL